MPPPSGTDARSQTCPRTPREYWRGIPLLVLLPYSCRDKLLRMSKSQRPVASHCKVLNQKSIPTKQDLWQNVLDGQQHQRA
eukprot:2263830-Amphidinium_carterae.1